MPYLASWAEEAAPDTFQRVAELVDRLARRLEDALGADKQHAGDDQAAAVLGAAA